MNVFIKNTIRSGKKNSNCGAVQISNGVDVWFSDIHPIKNEASAIIVANKIIKLLNRKNSKP